MHRFVIGVMCAAALGLAGCILGGSDKVAQGVSHAAQDEPAGAAQDTRQADGADTPLDFPELSDFTTEGKPTKTIETPWGPREVYDPTQDEEVVTAFKKIYDSNKFGQALHELADNEHSLNAQYKILRFAETAQLEGYFEHNCRLVKSSECGSWYEQIENCKVGKRQCQKMIITRVPNNTNVCELGNKTLFNRNRHPIGRNFFFKSNHTLTPNRKPLSLQSQIENYFLKSCINSLSEGDF